MHRRYITLDNSKNDGPRRMRDMKHRRRRGSSTAPRTQRRQVDFDVLVVVSGDRTMVIKLWSLGIAAVYVP